MIDRFKELWFRFQHWWEVVVRRKDRYVSDEWRQTWEQHERDITGEDTCN